MMERSITVDKERCTHCGQCVKDCFIGCLVMGNDNIPCYADGYGHNCVGCQHCMAVCPTGALSFGEVNQDELLETGYGDPDEIMNLIRSRRSIRRYKKQDVPLEKLEMIRQMLAYSPTTANLPDLHFSIIGTREKMDAIREATYKNVKTSRPTSSLYQFSYNGWLQGEDMIYRDAPSMVVAAVNSRMLGDETLKTVDPIIALSYVDLYAQSLGLGTLWDYAAFQVLRSYPDVLRMAEIPRGYELSFVMLLGIPDVNYRRVVKKEPASVRII